MIFQIILQVSNSIGFFMFIIRKLKLYEVDRVLLEKLILENKHSSIKKTDIFLVNSVSIISSCLLLFIFLLQNQIYIVLLYFHYFSSN